jgi:quinol monooxygenase YgiN
MMLSLLELVPQPDKRTAILDVLATVEGLTRVKEGCIGCGVYEARGDEPTILYMEQWQTKEDLYAHIRSDLYFRILAAMELAVKVPNLRFHEVFEPMGMELIRNLRGETKE